MKRAVLAIASLAITLAACGGSQHVAAGAGSGSGSGSASATPAPATPAITPGIQPAAWLIGDWTADQGQAELHWVAAAGALYGVQFDHGTPEVTMIDDTGEAHGLVLWSYDAHGPGGPTPAGEADPHGLRFTQANDAPSPIARTFTRTGDAAMITGGTWAMGQALDTRSWKRAAEGAAAPALEDADRAFADATAARGPDGWTDAFAPDGVNWGGARLVQGRAAIRADIAELLATSSLAWTPVASRLASTGDLGFTVGTFAVITRKAVVARGSYITVWKKQPDGSWKVLSDAGRPAN
jgi:ketosteroid isomerase-like protein